MTDRELLEAAAKAAGIGGGWDWPRGADKPTCWRDSSRKAWQPLHDDGDALRLAVKLKIAVHYDDPDAVMAGWLRQQNVPFTIDGFGPWFWKEWLRDNGADSAAATRRAIVRAAAEIGK